MSQERPSSISDAIRRWEEKLTYLEIEKATTANASQGFELQKHIEECQKEIQRLENAQNPSHEGTLGSTKQAFLRTDKYQTWGIYSEDSKTIPLPNKKIIEVFVLYSPTDTKMLAQLEMSFAGLEEEGIIKIWHEGKIKAGQRRLVWINERLNSADVILLLVSRRFMALDAERKRYVEQVRRREEAKEAHVIPILLSPVASWKRAWFGELQFLPRNEKPVSGGGWSNHDVAFSTIAEEFGEMIRELSSLISL